jgi:hypothetical protein
LVDLALGLELVVASSLPGRLLDLALGLELVVAGSLPGRLLDLALCCWAVFFALSGRPINGKRQTRQRDATSKCRDMAAEGPMQVLHLKGLRFDRDSRPLMALRI